jgi:hypothetical protein
MTIKRPAILLSFDVEEFDIPCEYGCEVSEAEQMRIGGEGFRRVLDLLAGSGIPTTLFCTAHFAAAHTKLMEEAAKAHEIASHGFYHSRFELEHLASSRRVLGEISGQRISGFRPARFRKVPSAAVRDAGFEYHSSENPIWLPGRYNGWARPRTVYEEDRLVQIPISASPWIRFPLFWLAAKNVPEGVFRAVAKWTLKKDGYLNLFFHPWELCDLTDYPLPGLVKRVSGAGMQEWLKRQIVWLGEQGSFETLGSFQGRFRG